MRYHEQKSYVEIGAVLGEKPGTVQARVARSLPRLRALI